MRKEKGHPAWWFLYVLGLASIGLLVLGALAPLSERGHRAAAMGSVLLACGLVEVWLRANRHAFLHIEGLTFVERTDRGTLHSAPDGAHRPDQDLRQPSAGALADIPCLRSLREDERPRVGAP